MLPTEQLKYVVRLNFSFFFTHFLSSPFEKHFQGIFPCRNIILHVIIYRIIYSDVHLINVVYRNIGRIMTRNKDVVRFLEVHCITKSHSCKQVKRYQYGEVICLTQKSLFLGYMYVRVCRLNERTIFIFYLSHSQTHQDEGQCNYKTDKVRFFFEISFSQKIKQEKITCNN